MAKPIRILLLAIVAGAAVAQDGPALPPPVAPIISDPSTLTATYERLVGVWLGVISPYATELFAALAGLDISLLGWRLWRVHGGDWRSTLTGLADKILVLGAFLTLLMNGPTWMGWIINSFMQIGKSASGVPSLSPSVIMLQGFKIFGGLFAAGLKAGLFLNIPVALALEFAGVCIFLSFLVITFQFTITMIQSFLAIGMGYIFLAFGGSSWTVPYVERYFAFAVATGVKLMVLYLMVGGGWIVTNTWVNQTQTIALTLSSIEQAWSIAAGSILFAGMCWFASSQISAMMGGSPNLSHSDFVSFMGPMVAGAVSAGFAVGAAGAARGAAASQGAAAHASSPSPSGGVQAPQSSGSSSRAGVVAGTIANTAARMPSSGHSGSPPHFSGFSH